MEAVNARYFTQPGNGGILVKYIRLMAGTQAGVAGDQNWAQSDRDTHMQTLGAVVKELVERGEFVATQPLAGTTSVPEQNYLIAQAARLADTRAESRNRRGLQSKPRRSGIATTD
jgi:hypothetical protein